MSDFSIQHDRAGFQPDDLQQLQRESGLAHLEYAYEMTSTSDVALRFARRDRLELPFLVLAEKQTRGRGRGTNAWWSSPGSLVFSLIVDDRFHRMQAASGPLASLLLGIGVCSAMEARSDRYRARVKWPNDVWLNGRKVGGILVESTGSQPARWVIGCGINLNNSLIDAPPELRPLATSVYDELGEVTDPLGFLRDLIRGWQKVFAAYRRDPNWLSEQWRHRSALDGEFVSVQSGGQEVRGRCLGIDDDGALLLQSEDRRHRLISGTVGRLS